MRISWPHILVLVLIVVLLFGASRLPDIARNLGKSMKIMKDEVKDLRDDPAAQPPAAQPPVAQPPSAVFPTAVNPTTDQPVAPHPVAPQPTAPPSSPYQPGGVQPDLPNQPRP